MRARERRGEPNEELRWRDHAWFEETSPGTRSRRRRRRRHGYENNGKNKNLGVE